MIQLAINFSLLSASQPIGLKGVAAADRLIGAVSLNQLSMKTIGNRVRWIDLSMDAPRFDDTNGGLLKLDGIDRPVGRGGRYKFCGFVPLRH